MARSGEDRRERNVVIQEEMGHWLSRGSLTPDQSQMFLTNLMGIRIDYSELTDKRVYVEFEASQLRPTL